MKIITKKIYILHKRGLTDRAIGRKLHIHHRTVAHHRIILKLKSNGRISQTIEMVNSHEARCSECKKVLDLNNFSKGRQAKSSYYFSYCNFCRTIKINENVNSSRKTYLKNKLSRLRERCRRCDITFDLTWDQFADQYKKQKGKCFYTDASMLMGAGKGRKPECLSIDKIIPDRGYIDGNIVFCQSRINIMKSDATLEEMKKWMPDWYNRIINFLGDF